MAPKPEYCEYERCNSAPHTCDIAIWVPYISHLAVRNCPNLPYVSQVVWCVGVSPRFRTGWGFILSDFGDGVAESWEMPSSESERNGLILSDFEEVGGWGSVVVGGVGQLGWAAGTGIPGGMKRVALAA